MTENKTIMFCYKCDKAEFVEDDVELNCDTCNGKLERVGWIK